MGECKAAPESWSNITPKLPNLRTYNQMKERALEQQLNQNHIFDLSILFFTSFFPQH